MHFSYCCKNVLWARFSNGLGCSFGAVKKIIFLNLCDSLDWNKRPMRIWDCEGGIRKQQRVEDVGQSKAIRGLINK